MELNVPCVLVPGCFSTNFKPKTVLARAALQFCPEMDEGQLLLITRAWYTMVVYGILFCFAFPLLPQIRDNSLAHVVSELIRHSFT